MKRMCLSLAVVAMAMGVAAPVSGQSFGNSISIGDDVIVVGEPSYELRSGVAYVFQRDASGSWTRSQRLEPSDAEAGNRFGIRLATQDDLLLVSATRADQGTGAVYVFENQNGNWTETGRLETSDRSPADSLGSGLAIDGDWIAVGTIAHNGARGAAYTFRRQGGEWVQHSKIAPEGLMPEDRFGSNIALSDGRMLVAAGSAGGGQGAVYAYQYDAASDSWQSQGQLQAPQMDEQTGFGADMAIADGIALVGAPGFLGGLGAALMYVGVDQGWQLATFLTPFETTGGTAFGASVDFDGEIALVGAMGAGRGQGAIFAYELDRETMQWTSADQVFSDEGGRAFFAATVALGGNVAVGAALGADNQAGAAWVVERRNGEWVPTDRITGDVLGIDAITGDEVPCTEEGEAALFSCESVDLLAFLPLGEMGADRGVGTNDVWGWTDPETGREIALVGMTNQTVFVDVSNPGNPVYLGRLPKTPEANAAVWRDMKVYDNHMYVVADGAGPHGMQVFDLTRLRGLDGSDPQTFEPDVLYDQIASAHNIVINEETGYAYAVGASAGGTTCGGGLHMIDIRNPKSPEFVGCFQDMSTGRQRTGYSHDAQCVVYHGPDEDYQGREICLGANETALSIADVTDKDNPVAVAMASYPNVAYSHQGWLSEDHAFFYMGDELDEGGGNVETTRTLIWDLRDLDDPVLAAEYMADTKATDHNLYILGNTMYQSNYTSGLRVLDISDPVNPVPVGFFDTVPYGGDTAEMDGSWSNYPYFDSGIVVVTSQNEGLFLVRYRPRTISQ
ncbi:MAG: choice-of-anchor B family protein [Longimicrobiales bacterium]|nr:choice-of-anchor B family protein [Longimicrobiales bacterium]